MSNKIDYQHVYLYMDDSGKISKYEDYAVFAGIVFKNNSQKSKFTNMYRNIIRNIKCSYCVEEKKSCDKKCSEVKACGIEPQHRRQIVNLSKEYTTFGVVTYNKNLYSHIINDKGAKGRFVEYSQRRVIKSTIQYLIRNGELNPSLPIYLHVNIDQMPTKSNGYYNLKEGLTEELRHGIVNFNYAKQFKPIVYSDLVVDVSYRDSKLTPAIQMADILANTVRRSFVFNNNWFDTYDYLTKKCRFDILIKLP